MLTEFQSHSLAVSYTDLWAVSTKSKMIGPLGSWKLDGCKKEAIQSYLRAMTLLWSLGSISSGHFYILAGCRLVLPELALHAV